jgi:hypothetical protein
MWFTKKKAPVEVAQQIIKKGAVEIVAHQNARKEVVEDAAVANKQLKDLLEANGFTIKIYLAAGGRSPKTHKGAH